MDVLYNLAVRMSFTAPAVATSIAAITNLFSKMGQEAKAAENAVATMVSRVEANARRLQDATARLSYAQAALMQRPNSLAAQYGADRAQIGYDRAQAALASSQSELAATNMAAVAAGQRAAQAHGGMALLGMGAAVTGAGVLGADMVSKWLRAAETMQDALAQLGLFSQGTKQQLDALGDSAYQVASKTRMSAPDVLHIATLAATNGLNNRRDILTNLLTLSQGAEIAQVTKHIGADASVPALIQMAHMFQAYGGGSFGKMVNLAVRAMGVSGASPSELATTMAYMMPAMHAYHLSTEDVASATALAFNVGLAHGRGGGALAAMFRAIAPGAGTRGGRFSGHNAALAELQHLGGGQFFTGDHFNGLTAMLDITMRGLAAAEKQGGPGAAMKLAQAVYGAAGSRAVMTMASQGAIARFQNVQALLGGNGLADINTMQETLAGTAAGGWAIARTNMQSLAAILGQQLLPAWTKVGQAAAKVTGAIVEFASKHKDLTKFVAVFVAVASAAALIVGPLLMAAGAFQVLAATGLFAEVALGPITLIVLGVAAAIAGLVLIVTHWGQVSRAAVGVWNGVAQACRIVWEIIDRSPLGPFVRVALLPFKEVVWAIGEGLKVLPGLLQTVHEWVSKLAGPLKQILDAAGKVMSGIPGAAGSFLNWAGVSQQDNPFIQHAHTVSAGRRGDTHHHVHQGDTHVHVHITGADAQTQEQLGRVVAAHVAKVQGKQLHHDTKNAALSMRGLVPRYR